MAKMTNESVINYAYQAGPYRKYSSKYTWTLHDWSLFYESNPRKGATSTSFNLNGTPGYTCKLSFSESSSDWVFGLQLSDTQGIKAIKVTSSSHLQFEYSYNSPIPKSLTVPTSGMFNQTHQKYIFRHFIEDTVKMVIKITVVRESDVFSRIVPTAVSPMMFSTSDSPPPDIAALLKTMFEQKTLCDVTLVVEDEKFSAHKVVLAAQSKVFEAMFSSGMKEHTDNVIEISNTTAEVFQEFLNYLYSGKVTELEKMVEEMIVLADFYNVNHLKIMSENIMLKSLSQSSAIRYLALADKLNCDTLKNETLHFIRNSTFFEKVIVEEDIETMKCLKAILSNGQAKEPKVVS